MLPANITPKSHRLPHNLTFDAVSSRYPELRPLHRPLSLPPPHPREPAQSSPAGSPVQCRAARPPPDQPARSVHSLTVFPGRKQTLKQPALAGRGPRQRQPGRRAGRQLWRQVQESRLRLEERVRTERRATAPGPVWRPSAVPDWRT